MILDTLRQLQSTTPQIRSLVSLYWIYTFAISLTGAFTHIFLYTRFDDLVLNIWALIFSRTGIMVGFCIGGYVASVWSLNIKRGFWWSFLFLSVSFIVLAQSTTPTLAYLAMGIQGVGHGLFWLTIHTFEMTETKDHERDFYSSLLSAGDQFLTLVGPAIATLLILISTKALHWNSFTLLFLTTPLFYLSGFFFLSSLREYRPPKVEWADVVHFVKDKKNRMSQLFLMGDSFEFMILLVILPLVIYSILGTELRVGVFNTLFAIFSVLCLLIVARYRTPNNRLLVLGVSTLLLVPFIIWLGYSLSLVALGVCMVAQSILQPLRDVSMHVITLQTMESIGRSQSDFYATLLLRDFSLWVWRMLIGLTLIVFAIWLPTDSQMFSLSMYLLCGAYVITFGGAYVLLKE